MSLVILRLHDSPHLEESLQIEDLPYCYQDQYHGFEKRPHHNSEICTLIDRSVISVANLKLQKLMISRSSCRRASQFNRQTQALIQTSTCIYSCSFFTPHKLVLRSLIISSNFP